MLKSLTRFHSANKIDNYNRGVKEKKKKLESLIRFHSANKIDNYNGMGREKKGKKSKRIYRTSQNIRIKNVFLA